MKLQTLAKGLVAGTVMATVAGCQMGSCCRQPPPPRTPPPGIPACPPAGVLVAPPAPTPTVPGPPITAAPGAPGYLPPAPGLPRNPVPADIRNYPPGPQPPVWRYPNDTGARYLPNNPGVQAPPGNVVQAPPGNGVQPPPRDLGQPPSRDVGQPPSRDVVQLQAPQYDRGPATMPRAKEESSTAPPPAAIPPNPPQQSPAPPVGISQFAMARDQVASGIEPFEEGFAYLKQENYRTVLHLRAPDEDDAAAREKVTQKGMQFRSIEISPDTLTQNVLDEFAKTVNDRDVLPLFVYDRDGIAAGAMWYLYFRNVDKLSDSEARSKAGRLGFRNDEASKKMLLAVQKLLNDQLK